MERNERRMGGCLLIISALALGISLKLQLASRSRPGQEQPSTQLQGTKRGKAKEDIERPPPPPGWRGFSMEEAMRHAQADAKTSKAATPAQVLQDLQRGNTRFWMRSAKRKEGSAFERRALIMQQSPTVAVLGCSDSRVPVEIVFDMGLGDIFVVRNAGNVAGTTAMASLQYAVRNLKVKVLVVMAHEGCGAVRAAQADDKQLQDEPKELRVTLMSIKKSLENSRLDCVKDRRARDREAAVTNLRSQLQTISDDAAIMAQVRRKELIVVGAFYEISSGIVDFIPLE